MAIQKKRLISLMTLIGMTLILLKSPVLAAYENTHINTGNQAEDILAIAATQVGYTEGSNNETKYGAWYPMNYNPWCAMFVSWCAEQAGIPRSVIPRHASCDIGMNWFKNNHRWEDSAYHGGSYIPQAGDIIYFGVIGDSNHVGIVRYSANGYVYTVEGNTSNMVKNKSYALDNSKILGYGIPAYSIPEAPVFVAGDITGDGTVDSADAILLFRHSMLPEQFPIGYTESCDFTKNGTVDINDAILLFQHSINPQLFPIS